MACENIHLLIQREAQKLESSRIMNRGYTHLEALIPKALVHDWDKPYSKVFDDARSLGGLTPQPSHQLSNALAGRTVWITYPIEKNPQQLGPKWVIQLNLTRPTVARLKFNNVVPITRVSNHQRTPQTALTTTMPFRTDLLHQFAYPALAWVRPHSARLTVKNFTINAMNR